MESERISKLRELYFLIYSWHKNYGRECYETNNAHDKQSKYYLRYTKYLESLPLSELASIDEIRSIAKEVICGCMEWSYSIIIDSDHKMFQIAKKIIAILDNHITESELEKLRELKNTGVGSKMPRKIELKIPLFTLNENSNLHYGYFARLAYSDVPESDNNLGGLVTLADANFEISLKMEQNDELEHLCFWNASALHFDSGEEKNSLVSLIKNGDLSIESVVIS